MESLTFGTLPEFETFEARFNRATEGHRYVYDLKGRDMYTAWKADMPTRADHMLASEMYGHLQNLIKVWETAEVDEAEMAGDLASSFMSTLGFKWI